MSRYYNRLPDLYDPSEPLEFNATLPLYHISDLGGFASKHGLVYRGSKHVEPYEGISTRVFVHQALKRGATVMRVYKGLKDWEPVEAPPGDPVTDHEAAVVIASHSYRLGALERAAEAKARAPRSKKFPGEE